MAVIPNLKANVANLQLDGIPVEVSVERLENARSFTMSVKLSVPDVDRFSSNPDSRLVANAIQAAIAEHGHRLRLVLIPDAQVQSEFERLQDDGSVREMLPQEGTW